VLSIPRIENPLYDSTGEMATNNQHGKIWFLAGTTEHIEGSAGRQCTIPKPSAILVPLFNVIVVMDENINTNLKLQKIANKTISSISDLTTRVDNIQLADLKPFRIQSMPFNVLVKENNFLSLSEGMHTAISDGYWMMLSEINTGKHIVRFAGRSNLRGHEFAQDVTYHINVT
jgi:hypothetical protein